MTDRELLELAAQAAGLIHDDWRGNAAYMNGLLSTWNPLTDDGDALRLAVLLGISVWRDSDVIWCSAVASVAGDAPCAAARRAIVRAAADIGKRK